MRLSDKDTSHKEVQLLKQLEPKFSNDAGKTIVSNASQLEKQASGNAVSSLFGNVTEAKELQSEKHLFPILCTLSGIVISLNPLS